MVWQQKSREKAQPISAQTQGYGATANTGGKPRPQRIGHSQTHKLCGPLGRVWSVKVLFNFSNQPWAQCHSGAAAQVLEFATKAEIQSYSP